MGQDSFIDILRTRASTQPEGLAFTFLKDGETEAGRLTYQGLEQEVRAIAARLQALDLAGERALLIYPPGLAFVSAFLGCLYAGVVAVPVPPPRRGRAARRLAAIAAGCQAKVGLAAREVLVDGEPPFPEVAGLKSLPWLATEAIPLDGATAWTPPRIGRGTVAFLQYTSGTTALPKGVMVSHGNLLHNSQLIYQIFNHGSQSRGVIWLPPYHDMGLIGGILQPIYGGFPVTLMSPLAFLQKPSRWLQAISRYRATTSGGPNFAYELCLRQIAPEALENIDLSCWQVAFNGAEPVRAQTLERFAAAFEPWGFRPEAFHPCYGLAEATLMVSGRLDASLPRLARVEKQALQENRVAVGEGKATKTLVGLGKPSPDQQLRIVHPDTLEECPPDRVGEIWLAGASVARGYWNDPQLTQETFQAYPAGTPSGPFLRTGDLGFIRDGELFLTGRCKDAIIIRGRNYYPQDIELSVEGSHPALEPGCSAAFALDTGEEEGLAIAAEVRRTSWRQLNVPEVVAAIRQAVWEGEELPVQAVVLLKTGSLPKTSSGKIQRQACREEFLQGHWQPVGEWREPTRPKAGAATAAPAPEPSREAVTEGEVRTWLVAHLAAHLGVSPDDIDVEESFAHYGLDSSVIASTAAQLKDWLGREVEPTVFWRYCTVEALAGYLGQSEARLS